MGRNQIQDTIHRGHFRKGTFVTLKGKYYPKPLHILIKQTNQITSFDQPMKRLQDHPLNTFCAHCNTVEMFSFFLWSERPEPKVIKEH